MIDIPMIKSVSDEQILDILANCADKLMDYYQSTNEYSALAASQDARDAYVYLSCELACSKPGLIH